MAKETNLKVGSQAPDFMLPDEDGYIHRLSDVRGKWALIYFYPKDDTPGCTKEACAIRDNFPHFKKLNIVVFGISADSAKSHKKFREKYNLPFTLLSDPEKETIHVYEAWGSKSFMGRIFDGILRMSFLVDPSGNIAKIYDKVKPNTHAEEVLADIRALNSKS